MHHLYLQNKTKSIFGTEIVEWSLVTCSLSKRMPGTDEVPVGVDPAMNSNAGSLNNYNRIFTPGCPSSVGLLKIPWSFF